MLTPVIWKHCSGVSYAEVGGLEHLFPHVLNISQSQRFEIINTISNERMNNWKMELQHTKALSEKQNKIDGFTKS